MQRRAFLVAAGAAVLSSVTRTNALASLGTLTWIEDGSLWIRELPDGRALRLTSVTGLHSPRFSPSGRWITFQDGADKRWLIRNDGQAGAALDANAAAFLPKEDLALLRPDGVFAPDGQRYVFSRDLDTDNGPSVGQLCLESLATPDREPEVLLFDQNGGKEPYGWTRDGKSVIYWSCDEWGVSPWSDGVGLYLVDVESGRSRELGVTALYDRDMLDVAPVSVGNQLAVTEGGGRETWAEKRITVIDLVTNVSRHLTPEDIAAVCPAWSPDGSGIAYFAGPDPEIAYARARAGTNYQVIRPDGSAETKTFTPETRISIGGGEEAHMYAQQRKIWLVDPRTNAAPKQLTNDPYYRDEEPLWSADRRHILFARMDYEGHRSLWLMEANGANTNRVCALQVEGNLDESWFGYYGYIDWRRAFDWRS